jgi:hypothetical protein
MNNKECRHVWKRTDGVFGVGGVVGCLGGPPLGERGGAVGGRVLVSGGEDREEEEQERWSHAPDCSLPVPVWSVCLGEAGEWGRKGRVGD